MKLDRGLEWKGMEYRIVQLSVIFSKFLLRVIESN